MKIYFIGIAGAGMHSLANYLSQAGHIVTGSDPGAGENCRRAQDHYQGQKIYQIFFHRVSFLSPARAGIHDPITVNSVS